MTYSPDDLTIWSSGLSEQYWTAHVYDTTDSIATVRGVDYISDAGARGMSVGDLVLVRIWTGAIRTGTLSAIYLMPVLSISSQGAADLADGTEIDTTNT